MKLNKYLIAAGVIGPILFFFIVYFLTPFFYPGYDIATQTISELGNADSPIKTFHNVFGFGLMGVFFMIFSFGIFRLKEINKLGKLAAVFFFITGAMMYLTGIFYGDVAGNSYSLRSNIHNIVANYQFPVFAVGLVLFAFSAASNRDLRWLTPVILFFGVITLILAYFLFLVIPPPSNIGILQRFAIGIPYLLLAIIAGTLYKNSNI